MKLARHLSTMPCRPASAREILHALIEHGDLQIGADGELQIVFAPDAATLDALMVFDAIDREDEQILEDEVGLFHGSGCSDAA